MLPPARIWRLLGWHHRSYDAGVARTDTLIQTLVSPELAAWVRARAAVDGLQVSGWIRQLIHRERVRLVIDAWWSPPSGTKPSHESDSAAPFRMERLADEKGDRVEFRWLEDSGRPVRERDVEKKHGVKRAQLDAGHFVLRGSPRAWRVVHAFADADDDGAMRLVLASTPSSGSGSRRRTR